MLKNSDKYDTEAHFTYDEYKKKTNKAPNKDVMVFASVFIVGVLIILGFAKILSPNVDVSIAGESDNYIVKDENNESSSIDERLRSIKMEDEGKQVVDEEMFSPELDERVEIPTKVKKTVGQIEAERAAAMAAAEHEKEKVVETKTSSTESNNSEQKTVQTAKPIAQPEQIVNAKVVVGYYATEKQAEVAKSIIQDAGLGITPIVKNLNGYYTLQVGSYSSREKAQQAANGLLKSNFPARVIVE